jgi:hypothetical protein
VSFGAKRDRTTTPLGIAAKVDVMSETNKNGPTPPDVAKPFDQSGNTMTVSCDEHVIFEEDASQPTSAWPWPEPPFVAEKPAGQPKS